MVMTIWQKIKWKFGLYEEPVYPIPHAIIDYTIDAKLSNIRDDQNKVILLYRADKYKNIQVVKYKYSKHQVAIMENDGIPVFDKTRLEQKFEVITKTEPGGIVYTR